MVSVIYQKRALPIYWCLLDKEGCSNFQEQQKVLRPVIRLLKNYQLVIIGDREFHGAEVWLRHASYRNKLPFYQQGLRAMMLIQQPF